MRRPISKLAATGALIFLIGYLLTAFEVVGPGEVVVVRRLGHTLDRPWTAGLQMGWPWGFEQRPRVRIDEVRRLAIGTARGGNAASTASRGEYLTGDQNLALVGAVVQYRVSEPAAYVAASAQREALLSDLADTALAGACARIAIDDLLRNRRQQFSDDVQATLAQEFQELGLGIEVLSVSVVEARPPEEVAPEFADAQAALSDRPRRATEGATEAARIEQAARSRAAAVEEQARTEAENNRTAAQGRADRFAALLGEASKDPLLTRRRLYLDAIERGFQRLGRRIVLEPGQAIDLSVLGVR